jgi:hypothetical protein
MAKMNRVMNNNEKFIFVNYEVLQKTKYLQTISKRLIMSIRCTLYII